MWWRVYVSTVTRGHVYVEASSSAVAVAMVEGATLQQAMANQTLREAIEEKISFSVIAVSAQVEGVDYKVT